MKDQFSNTYEDESRADSYATLEFPGTYLLAFRDLPEIIGAHVRGGLALDFGCGAGRSTRFLRDQGFDVVGADISERMIAKAREADPEGKYVLVGEGDLSNLNAGPFDLILSAFTFDNIPMQAKPNCLEALVRVLKPSGLIINLVSSPEIYVNEWTSFSTKDFPENADAKDGDVVRVVMLDVEDRRPVNDIFCSPQAYRELYERESLTASEVHKPLGTEADKIPWVNEKTIAPWTIYVLRRALHEIVTTDTVQPTGD